MEKLQHKFAIAALKLFNMLKKLISLQTITLVGFHANDGCRYEISMQKVKV